jgi:hypothetical protein
MYGFRKDGGCSGTSAFEGGCGSSSVCVYSSVDGLVESKFMNHSPATKDYGSIMQYWVDLYIYPEMNGGKDYCSTSLAYYLPWLHTNVFALGGRGTMGCCYRSDCHWPESRFGDP